jgi:K(+)-stimulated pyrophosphate-energized sodium pump
MKLFLDAKRRLTGLIAPGWLKALFATVAVALLPGIASANEGNVVLKFTSGDLVYLYVSMLVGAIAIAVAFGIRASTLAESRGSEKMQEVGSAIKEGALAYLKQQVKTMAIFVIILAVGLVLLYHNQYNSWKLGGEIAACFVLGVAASYVAGYTGMLMAVEGNMRTAHAALTSYAKTLRIAFRSGAVAGMITVGMGLLGASLIILLAQGDAMKLLVGFGFGGSLAALFMRVGGGIFTKAADVGADLVGKVEAGIPEDDPRNPATIADNVGDNVGDCAGMAADIFESYEVTLVAAIILGAATASVFDQSTWMKLILFALMARGVGIIASIFGIFSVKGSDDVDSDPLKAISKGFWFSAGLAIVLTFGLAFLLMGGSKPLTTSQIQDIEPYRRADMATIKQAVKDYQTKNPTATDPTAMVTAVLKDPRVAPMGLTQQAGQQLVQSASSYDPDTQPPLTDYSDYKPVDFNDKTDAVLSYSHIDSTNQTSHDPVSVGDFFSQTDPANRNKRTPKKLFMAWLKIPQPTPPPPAGSKTPPPPTEYTEGYFGPFTQDGIDRILKQNPKIEHDQKNKDLNVALYDDSAGHVAFAVDKPADFQSTKLQNIIQQFFKAPVSDMKDIMSGKKHTTPDFARIGLVLDNHSPVEWWRFALAITFGVLMAFAIERLTDYYVSTHKRPVLEIAGVSTAGPAPMIIQGFALAAESSVFSVFAIVIALIFPLIIFPPAAYGGSYVLSFYGIALVGLGLLTSTGFILAMDTFGPISDNAQGVFEMSGAGHESAAGSKAVQRLDAAGNTTKALTKGFAIATAVVAAVALYHSYLEDAHLTAAGIRLEIPEIFLGLLIGGAAPYLFAAFSINAVGRASFQLINEVRRQFREDAGIMAGTSKPNYGRCVAIVTEAAQKELLGPGILAICLPVAVAFGFSIGKAPVTIGGNQYNLVGAEALGGFLAGAILSGQLMAVLLANAGGMWDNAKKLIEDGLYGGKGSEAHKAGVVCDTVGDPFKDTAGPAMNPLIKVMNLVALLLAGVVIQPYSNSVLAIITIVALGLLAFSIWWSKRASFSSALSEATESPNVVPPPAAHAAAIEPPTTPIPSPSELRAETEEAEKEIREEEHHQTPPAGSRRLTVDDEDETEK